MRKKNALNLQRDNVISKKNSVDIKEELLKSLKGETIKSQTDQLNERIKSSTVQIFEYYKNLVVAAPSANKYIRDAKDAVFEKPNKEAFLGNLNKVYSG